MSYDADKFRVQILPAHLEGWGRLLHIKVQKFSQEEITREELQEIKNTVAGTEAQALEVYPPQRDCVSEKVRHLWVIGDWVLLPSTKHYPDY